MKQKVITFGGPRRRQPTDHDRAAAAGNARRKKRRTGRQTLNYLLVFTVSAAIMVTLSLTVFFKIESIEVTGVTKYAPQAIIDTSGIQKGDNLFRISDRMVRKTLCEKYAYIETVTLKRVLPAKLVIEVTQEQPLGALETSAGYVIVGKTGRVLELGAKTVDPDIMVVSGMYLYEPELGRELGTGYDKDHTEEGDREADGFKRLTYLVDAVAKTSFDKITRIDFSDRLNLVLVYDDRLIIELGVESDLVYKLRFVDRLIREEIDPTFEGTLDAASAADTKQVYTRPCNVAEELEKMKTPIVQPEQQPAETPLPDQAGASVPGEEALPPNMSTDPDYALIPGSASSKPTESSSAASNAKEAVSLKEAGNAESGSSASNTSSGSSKAQVSSSSQPKASSKETEGYTEDDLAVVPGTGRTPVRSQDAQSTQSTQNGES